MPNTNDHEHAYKDEDFVEVLAIRSHHEAAHAVFAYYDGAEVDEVWVSDKRGGCEIYRADLYERYQPWKFALFALAGAYAAAVSCHLQHPTIEEMPLSWLLEEAGRVHEGDAWFVVEALKKAEVAASEDSLFSSLQKTYSALFEVLGILVEERWHDIETVASALERGYWESGEVNLGSLSGDDVARIVKSLHKEDNHV